MLVSKNAYIEGKVFINNLNLTKTKYDRIYLHWGSIGNLNFDTGAYLSLLKNYDNLGWNDDNRNCYYSYRTATQNEELVAHEILPWSIDFLHWISYGYGIKPERPLIWPVIFILIFGSVFWRNKCINKLVREEIIEQKEEDAVITTNLKIKELSLEDPILFSLTTFTSGFTSFFHPNIEYKLDAKYMRLAIIERFLGSILIALFFAAIGKIYLTR